MHMICTSSVPQNTEFQCPIMLQRDGTTNVSLSGAGTSFTTEVCIEQLYYAVRLRWKVRQRPQDEFLTFFIWRQTSVCVHPYRRCTVVNETTNTLVQTKPLAISRRGRWRPVQLHLCVKTRLHLSEAAVRNMRA